MPAAAIVAASTCGSKPSTRAREPAPHVRAMLRPIRRRAGQIQPRAAIARSIFVMRLASANARSATVRREWLEV